MTAAPITSSAGHEPWTHRYARVDGVRLHYVEAGQGPLVVLLHGFPEFWYSWHHQIPALAARGFRVIAPDQRGYNLSDKPRGVDAYGLERLADDVAALVRHAGERRAVIVGHDWGGGVAWWMPIRHPELVSRLVVMNAPHPARFIRSLATLRQLRKSWYMFFFQLPFLPERALAAGDFDALARTLRRDPVRKGAFSEHDIRLYKEALSRPGADTATLNWYRAMFRNAPARLRAARRPIECPTMLVWGERDRSLGVELTSGLERWVPDLRLERIPEASHWVQVDAAARVNELLLDFLGAPAR